MRSASWFVVFASLAAIIYHLGSPWWGDLSFPAMNTEQVSGTTVRRIPPQADQPTDLADAPDACDRRLPENDARKGADKNQQQSSGSSPSATTSRKQDPNAAAPGDCEKLQ